MYHLYEKTDIPEDHTDVNLCITRKTIRANSVELSTRDMRVHGVDIVRRSLG